MSNHSFRGEPDPISTRQQTPGKIRFIPIGGTDELFIKTANRQSLVPHNRQIARNHAGETIFAGSAKAEIQVGAQAVPARLLIHRRVGTFSRLQDLAAHRGATLAIAGGMSTYQSGNRLNIIIEE